MCLCPSILIKIKSKMKWTGPAARINTETTQTEFYFINYHRNLRPLQVHRNAWKLMSDPTTVTGHRAFLGKMSHNILSKLTHETNVNTTGCLPLPEYYFYKQSAQPIGKNHDRISEAYALTHTATPFHIHRHMAVVIRTHFSRTLLAFTHAMLC